MGLGVRVGGQAVMVGLEGHQCDPKRFGDQSYGVGVRFWGQEVMVGLGLGWKGTKVALKDLGRNLWGFRWGFGVTQ